MQKIARTSTAKNGPKRRPEISSKLPQKTPTNGPQHAKIDRSHKDIPIEDLIEYKRKGLTLEEIGRLTGCSKVNVHLRLKEVDLDGLSRFASNKDQVLEYHQRRVVQSLTDNDIKRMSGLQKLIGIKLTDEAIRTIRGQAQEIIEVRQITADMDSIWDRWEKTRRKEVGEGEG